MDEQLQLFRAPEIRTPTYDPKYTARERWSLFHQMNPEVYRRIRHMALEQKVDGWKRSSMQLIFEHLRYLWAIQTKGDRYKLNHNYRSFYTRKLLEDHPELVGMFETRGNDEPRERAHGGPAGCKSVVRKHMAGSIPAPRTEVHNG